MYVCVCKAIKTQELTDLISSGAKTVQEIGQSCGAGTDCGSCVNRLKRILSSSCGGSTESSACCASTATAVGELPTQKAV